jgi:beta-lactamase class A
MKRALHIRFAILLGFYLAGFQLAGMRPLQEPITSESPARGEIEALIRDSGATVSLAFRALDGTQELFLNADARFEDPNALRIPVMITVYAATESHSLSLDDPVRPHSASTTAAPTIGEACETMITQNSDPATNLLLEHFGLAAIRAQIRSLGVDGMEIGAAFPNNEKNRATSRALLIVLWKLATDRVISPDASKEMVGLMARSTLHASAPAARPSKSAPPVAGPVLLHDAVIIYGARSFVLVIQIQGLKDYFTSAELDAKISKALADAM